MQAVITLVGRNFLALIFLSSGVSKIAKYSDTVAYMQQKGMPAAPFFLFAAVLIELSAALALITGYRARTGALLLVLFLVPTTYIFHYKSAFDAQMNVIDQIQMISLLKNIAIIGGLLGVYANGPGPWALGKKS
ncbi:MAG TPA: DoxX family protein [Oligoflexia bacterium]|nr:DoxX family protein [Oligoflexia bacterium]